MIAGAGGFRVVAAAPVTLTAVNTYSGGTTVGGDGGAMLVAANAAALGSTAAGTTVLASGTLALQGSIAIGNEALSITGAYLGGALRNLSGTNSYGGTVTLAGASTIQSDAGSLTLNNATAITGAGQILTLTGAGNGVVSGAIMTGAGALTKAGVGTWTLSGTNTYTGTTTISAGTLLVDGAIVSAVSVQSGATLGGDGTVGAVTVNGGTLSPGGADAMDGGDGDDKYYVDNAGDTVTDSSGFDMIYTTIDHVLGGGFERLVATSDAGLILTGNGADNAIVGRGGNDTITGGGGRDLMTGGAGADHFVFEALSDSLAGAQRDVIKDFQIGIDQIDLTAIDANTGLADDQAFNFIGAGPFTHHAGELQAKAVGANTLISGDVDGNGRADFQILPAGHVTLQSTDFLL